MRQRMLKSFRIVGLVPVILLGTGWGWSADLGKAIEFYRAKQYEQAEKELRAVLEEEPENVEAQYHLGLTLLELQKYVEAEQVLQKVASKAPRPEEVQIALTRTYLGLNQLEKAQKELEEAARIKPGHPGVPLYRGVLLIYRKDYAGAVKELDKAISLDPGQAYAHYYAGLAYSNLKRPDRMVNHFQTFLKLAPDAPEAEKVKAVLRSVR